MKLTLVSTVPGSIKFEDLSIGDCFISNKQVLIKINENYGLRVQGNSGLPSVMFCFQPYEFVEVCESELIVTPKFQTLPPK